MSVRGTAGTGDEQRSYMGTDETRGMLETIFEFDEKTLPLPVVLATVALIAIFAIGIPYRVVVGF